MTRTKEEKERLLRIIASIHCLWDERPNLSDEEQQHLDAIVARLVEMIPDDLRVFL
jgi:hypothetical protein